MTIHCNRSQKITNADCQGVITPSCGPPIKTKFLSLAKFFFCRRYSKMCIKVLFILAICSMLARLATLALIAYFVYQQTLSCCCY